VRLRVYWSVWGRETLSTFSSLAVLLPEELQQVLLSNHQSQVCLGLAYHLAAQNLMRAFYSDSAGNRTVHFALAYSLKKLAQWWTEVGELSCMETFYISVVQEISCVLVAQNFLEWLPVSHFRNLLG